ncbi:protein arginine kinase [Clostridium grantii]|uniref:Protein-arginine kinase n=1 Tax=Clostridium grantii DSM 8605 TaxID=1121316 RepID=A0A1M5XP92_9CLOT|nr:protein arginine kinase [Clostridium grantii]SHI01621.1 protein arginine kinase [Clostridium grantii DSM 8605]
MQNWINTQSDNIVLSSRIRLARNLKGIPFPNMLKEEKGKDIVAKIEEAFYNNITEKKYLTYYLWHNNDLMNTAFLEKHLISNNLLKNKEMAAFIMDDLETMSIMINEEDHIRLQSITSGLNLEEAYNYIDKIDDFLEENLDYAFSEELGYITSCPSNLGTGMRASVMIHLPTLTMTNEISGVINDLNQMGMTIRGLYGEGSKPFGNLYQVSNQITLGLKEDEIISKLTAVINGIINREIVCRKKLLKNKQNELKDKVYRSIGILKSAILLKEDECLNMLSDVRMGVEMGIINDISIVKLNKLAIDTQWAIMQSNNDIIKNKNQVSNEELRLIRAKLVKDSLNSNDN